MQSIIDEYDRIFNFKTRIGKYIALKDWGLFWLIIFVLLIFEVIIDILINKCFISTNIITLVINGVIIFVVSMLNVIGVTYFFLKPKVSKVIREKYNCSNMNELDEKCKNDFIIWLKGKKIDIHNKEQMDYLISGFEELMKSKRPKTIIEKGVLLGVLLIPFTKYIEYIYDTEITNRNEAFIFLATISVILVAIYMCIKLIIIELNALNLWVNGNTYRKIIEVKKALEILRIIGMDKDN